MLEARCLYSKNLLELVETEECGRMSDRIGEIGKGLISQEKSWYHRKLNLKNDLGNRRCFEFLLACNLYP